MCINTPLKRVQYIDEKVPDRIKTSLDLIQYIDEKVPDRHLSSSRLLSLVSGNPDMIEWAVKHNNIHRSQMRLFEEKKISGNPNMMIVQNLKYLDSSDIDHFYLSTNSHPNALKLIEECPQDIWYGMLCQNANPQAVKIIEDLYMSNQIKQCDIYYNPYVKPNKMESVNFGLLAANPSAADFVLRELSHYMLSNDPMHRMIWIGLSKNPNPKIIDLLTKYPDRIDTCAIASNPNSKAIELLVALLPNYRKWNWRKLSANPAAISYLKRYPEMIQYKHLAANPHQWAIRKFAMWYVQNKNKHAFELMLQFNYKDKYLHQYVDFE